MPRYSMNVLGLEVSFRTDASQERVEEARKFVEELYDQLNETGKNLSKERLLTVLTLSLADEYLQAKRRLEAQEGKLGSLLSKVR